MMSAWRFDGVTASAFIGSYKRVDLREVIDFLHDRTGGTFVVDPTALKRLKLDESTPVMFEAKRVTLRIAFQKILGNLDLSYVVKGDVIQVVSPQVAQSRLTTQSYYIGDLIPPPPPAGNQAAQAARLKWVARGVIHKIVDTIEPDSWQASGNGPGTLWYNPATRSIVVRNSSEVQLSLRSSFAGNWVGASLRTGCSRRRTSQFAFGRGELPDPLVHLAAVHAHLGRGSDANFDPVAFDFGDRDDDRTVEDELFADFARKDQHNVLLREG